MNSKKDVSPVGSEYQAFLDKANVFIDAQKTYGFFQTPFQARMGLDSITSFYLPELEVAQVVDTALVLHDREIPVRIYDPDPEQVKPVIVFMHGGGHMCGSVDLYDAVTRRLTAHTGQLVLSIDYRLAPEFPYPCGLNDCQVVVEHLDILLEGHHVDLEQITLAGDSAGGALACSVAWKTTGVKIHRLLMIYPSLDYTFSTPSYKTLDTGYLLETEKIRWSFNQYFDRYTEDADRKKASPLFFSELKHLPKTLIIAAQLDPLIDEGKLFHQRLLDAGIDSEHVEHEGVIHCFLNLEKLNPTLIDETYERIAAFVAP